MYTKNISQERYYTPLRGKAAYLRDWQNNPVRPDQIPPGENVGLLLEHAGLVDVDCDTLEARAVAGRFLPRNTLSIGRGGTVSHLIYEGAAENRTIKHPSARTDTPVIEVKHAGR